MGKYVRNIDCVKCEGTQSAACYIEEDDRVSSSCFKCKHYTHNVDKEIENTYKGYKMQSKYNQLTREDILQYPFADVPSRGIHPGVYKYFGIRMSVNTQNGEADTIYYPYYIKDALSGYKVRTLPKHWQNAIGSIKGVDLFGQHLCKGGNRLYITEGEEDALAVYFVLRSFFKTKEDNKDYRPSVVSIVTGAGGLVSALKGAKKLLAQYKEIVYIPDNDEEGKKTIQQAYLILKEKLRVVMLEEKDASEMVQAGQNKDLLGLLLKPETYKPGSLLSFHEVLDQCSLEPDYAFCRPYPDFCKDLTFKTGGRRFGDLDLLIAGTGCVDADTEFFTGKGWKRIAEYQKGDKVLQYNMNGTADLVEPEEYVKEESDGLYHFSTKYGISQTLCDFHNVIYIREESDKIVKTQFSDIKDSLANFRGRFITAFNVDTDKSLDMSEDEIRLRVALDADGYQKSPNRIYVRIKRERKIERFRMLLDKAKYSYKEYKQSNGFICFQVQTSIPKGIMKNWYNASFEQLKVITEECLLWHGDQKAIFFTSKKDEADFIQYAFSATGRKAYIGVDTREGRNDSYRVITTNKILTGTRNHNEEVKITSVESDGYKYCFKVPSEMLVLRNNNCVFVTGNCGKSTLMREMVLYDLERDSADKVGVLFLEESAKRFGDSLISLAANKRFHIDNNKQEHSELFLKTKEDLKVKYGSKLIALDHFGSTDETTLKEKLEYMAEEFGAKWIYIDHLSMILGESKSGNDQMSKIDSIIDYLAKFVIKYNVWVFLAAHLRKSVSGSGNHKYEKGLTPDLDDIKSTGSIKQMSFQVMALQRNLYHSDPTLRNVVAVHVLKNRYSGRTGCADYLALDEETGRFNRVKKPDTDLFERDNAGDIDL